MSAPYAKLVGEPCESLRRNGAANKACGQPSKFLYRGIDPRALKLTVAQSKRYIRATLLMCPDCAKALAEAFAWQIKDGHVRLERLDVNKFRLHCTHCGVFVHVMWDTDAPQSYPGAFAWCPRCGANATYRLDPEADYWDVLSESLENMPVELVKLLYVEWDRGRYQNFFTYVKAQIAQFDTTNTFEAAR